MPQDVEAERERMAAYSAYKYHFFMARSQFRQAMWSEDKAIESAERFRKAGGNWDDLFKGDTVVDH